MNEEPFCCSQCESKFANPTDLKAHEDQHQKGKPFNCDNCDKKFFGKSSENEVVIESEEDLARTFNHFFPSKVEKIEKNIPFHDVDPISKLREKLKGRGPPFQV